MVRKYEGPAYGPKAKKAIKAMIASGEVLKVTGRRGRKPKVSATVKAYVKKAIDTEIEDKLDVQQILTTAGGSTTGLVRGYGINSGTANYGITTVSVIPTVPLGTDTDKRIGNSIRPKSLYVHYTLNATPIDTGITDAINQQAGMPYYVAVLFYSRKDNRTSSLNTNIKDFGSINFSFETINDFLLPFNKDVFNILSFKKYKMYPSQEKGLFGTTVTTSETRSINGYVPMVMCRQKLKLPNKLMFDDNASQPTNARIFCAIGVFNIDNSVPDRATTIRVKAEMNSYLYYQNA